VSSIAKGLITDIEAASLLGPARRELAQIEAELATAETDTNVIELHAPAGRGTVQAEVEGFGRYSRRKRRLPDLELVGTFRSLVESVVVRPRKAGEQYEVNIRGISGQSYGG
jgi:hypothetical protein